MKIKLVRALGVLLTAGMLAGGVGPVAAGAEAAENQGTAGAGAEVPESQSVSGAEAEDAAGPEGTGSADEGEPAPEGADSPSETGGSTGGGNKPSEGAEESKPSADGGSVVEENKTSGEGGSVAEENKPSAEGGSGSEADKPSGGSVAEENKPSGGSVTGGDSHPAGADSPSGGSRPSTDAGSLAGGDKPSADGAGADVPDGLVTVPETPVPPEFGHGDEEPASGLDVSGGISGSAVNGWVVEDGRHYWYEGGVRQGDREIYDPETGLWYRLDSEGAMVTEEDVYLEAEARWVRYDKDGLLVRGEDYHDGGYYYFEPVTGTMVKGPWVLPDGRKVLYDTVTGQMVKGECEFNGEKYCFDEIDGHMTEGTEDLRCWLEIDDARYWYVGWERQGWKPEEPDYRGEELYDAEEDVWYWLDNESQGAMAVNKDVYQNGQADAEGNRGKWVRYDENGHMVRGWSEDMMYYFDLVYGTRAHGIVVIDGVEYEFDKTTGRRIVRRGFEEYGIECNVEEGVSYEYETATFANSELSTVGTAVFDYETFESDETHSAKEGYLWKRVVITTSFGDENGQVAGIRTSLLFNLDYYNFSNSELAGLSSEKVIEEERTISFSGEEYSVATRYELLDSGWGEDGNPYIKMSFECQVPAEYDGMVVALCHAGNREKGNRELDRIDERSLIFRME